MRSTLKIYLTLFLGLSFIPAAQADDTPALTNEQAQDYVINTFPYNIDFIHEKIELMFNSDTRDYYDEYSGKIYDLPGQVPTAKDLSPSQYKKFLKFPLVRPTKFYVFLGAYANMQHVVEDITPLAAMGHSNAALQRYAALPVTERSQDIYLWSPDIPYWHSEYSLDGKPLPFRSYFIMHLAPIDESHTSVEIIEDQPVVEMGKKLSVDEHGIVHRFDIREVEPTTADREFLLSCLHQFIDRKLPGRHYFNCKTQAELDTPPPTPFTVP